MNRKFNLIKIVINEVLDVDETLSDDELSDDDSYDYDSYEYGMFECSFSCSVDCVDCVDCFHKVRNKRYFKAIRKYDLPKNIIIDSPNPQLIDFANRVITADDYGPHTRKVRSVLSNFNGIELNFEDFEFTKNPVIPKGCKILNFVNCKNVHNLPELPDSLEVINLSGTDIINIKHLPKNLRILKLEQCTQLTELPLLPQSLTELDITRSGVSNLPALPASLKVLEISNTNIGYICELPDYLEELWCYGTKLSTLPYIPETIKFLHLNGIMPCPPVPAHMFSINWYDDITILNHSGYLTDICKESLIEKWNIMRIQKRTGLFAEELVSKVFSKIV